MCWCAWGSHSDPSHPPRWTQTQSCETYLPDGDIDLAVLKGLSKELAKNVLDILNNEEHNKDSKLEANNKHFIKSEIIILKIRVHDILVDITFNKIGGLRSHSFLYMMDNHIGEGHIFKKAVVLIKAWCYYESRMLGANHGPVSTCRLEILILHIFNVYHRASDVPLQALCVIHYYFREFHRNKYCAGVCGPLICSSWECPELLVERQQSGCETLERKDFITDCFHVLALNSMDQEAILDPVKTGKKLRRSVSNGNLHRISSAFSNGSASLEEMPRHNSVAWALGKLTATGDAEPGAAGSHATSAQLASNAGDLVDRLTVDFTSLHITEGDMDDCMF